MSFVVIYILYWYMSVYCSLSNDIVILYAIDKFWS